MEALETLKDSKGDHYRASTSKAAADSQLLEDESDGLPQTKYTPISYADVAKGKHQSVNLGHHQSGKLEANKFLVLSSPKQSKFTDPSIYHSSTTTDINGTPSISVTCAEKNRLVNNLRWVLVGKFSHGRPTLKAIQQFFKNIQLEGDINCANLDAKHIIIECSCYVDFYFIWMQLVWHIHGYDMRMFKWLPNFSTKVESSIAPTWIRIEGLALYLFDEITLLRIASVIGNPIKVDTRNVERLNLGSARICIELDVVKPIIDTISIDIVDEQTGETIETMLASVFYDVLPKFCNECSHIGHQAEYCKRKIGTTSQEHGKHTTAAAVVPWKSKLQRVWKQVGAANKVEEQPSHMSSCGQKIVVNTVAGHQFSCKQQAHENLHTPIALQNLNTKNPFHVLQLNEKDVGADGTTKVDELTTQQGSWAGQMEEQDKVELVKSAFCVEALRQTSRTCNNIQISSETKAPDQSGLLEEEAESSLKSAGLGDSVTNGQNVMEQVAAVDEAMQLQSNASSLHAQNNLHTSPQQGQQAKVIQSMAMASPLAHSRTDVQISPQLGKESRSKAELTPISAKEREWQLVVSKKKRGSREKDSKANRLVFDHNIQDVSYRHSEPRQAQFIRPSWADQVEEEQEQPTLQQTVPNTKEDTGELKTTADSDCRAVIKAHFLASSASIEEALRKRQSRLKQVTTEDTISDKGLEKADKGHVSATKESKEDSKTTMGEDKPRQVHFHGMVTIHMFEKEEDRRSERLRQKHTSHTEKEFRARVVDAQHNEGWPLRAPQGKQAQTPGKKAKSNDPG